MLRRLSFGCKLFFEGFLRRGLAKNKLCYGAFRETADIGMEEIGQGGWVLLVYHKEFRVRSGRAEIGAG